MPIDAATIRGTGLLQRIHNALSAGELLETIPDRVVELIRENLWQRRPTTWGEPEGYVTHARWADFVRAPLPQGMETDPALIARVCRGHLEAEAALAGVAAGESGKHGVDNINSSSRPNGTSRPYALRRLERQRPDLFAKVLAEELSPHAAAIEAGFRHPTVSLALDDMERLATALVRRLSRDDAVALMAALGGAIQTKWTDDAAAL